MFESFYQQEKFEVDFKFVELRHLQKDRLLLMLDLHQKHPCLPQSSVIMTLLIN
jgi:hypothetical protein